MTYLFKLIGGGDTMTGMTFAVLTFVGILALIVVCCGLGIFSNYVRTKKKQAVSLTSKNAKMREERRKNGVFNREIMQETQSEEIGVDITDPTYQQTVGKTGVGRHRKHHIKRKGLQIADPTPIKVNTHTNEIGISLTKKTNNTAENEPTNTPKTPNNPVVNDYNNTNTPTQQTQNTLGDASELGLTDEPAGTIAPTAYRNQEQNPFMTQNS